ncbi:MAG: hypothetical protein JWM97_2874 [Phycisphaerales bacterium]|jgi:hypothetical protein|nr:hypothetical protein [Phycisphaerales bacterium]
MNGVRKCLLAAVAISGLSLPGPTARAEDAKDQKDHTKTGVLIDNTCGAKQADETAAAKHPQKCAMKESCAASGYQLIVGDKHYKLDDKGNEKAKAYLAKADSTRVTIEGTVVDEKIEVTSIKAADKNGDKKDAK